MATYTLEIAVDSGEHRILAESDYHLCIAKKVNGAYNVVFKGTTFLNNNTIQWTDKYKVFGQQDFKSGALVKASTDVVDIQFGQTAILDHVGTMHRAEGRAEPTGKFSVKNEYGKICIGVMCDVEGVPTPIYVSSPIVTGLGVYEPKTEVMVWFSQTHDSETMFSEVVSNAHVVNFVGTTKKKIRYVANPARPGDGHWLDNNTIAFALDYHPSTAAFVASAITHEQEVTDRAVALVSN